jgi:hypothetical protein
LMTAPSSPTRPSPMAVLLGIGVFANFFDALGVGSFATTTAALRIGPLMDDENIPGTLNVGHATPRIAPSSMSKHFLVAYPFPLGIPQLAPTDRFFPIGKVPYLLAKRDKTV